MTLTKNKMVQEVGRHTRLKNRDVQSMLEALMEIWTEELVRGGRIELENFLILEVQIIDRGESNGMLRSRSVSYPAPRRLRQLTMRVSKHLKTLLKGELHQEYGE